MRTVVEGIRYNSTSEVTLAPPTYHRYQYPRHLDPTNPTTYHAHNLNTAVLANRVFIRPTPRVTTTLTDWKPTHNKIRNPNTPTTAPLTHSVDYSTRVHCNHCQTPFPSRNKLFHHLRTRNCSQNWTLCWIPLKRGGGTDPYLKGKWSNTSAGPGNWKGSSQTGGWCNAKAFQCEETPMPPPNRGVHPNPLRNHHVHVFTLCVLLCVDTNPNHQVLFTKYQTTPIPCIVKAFDASQQP